MELCLVYFNCLIEQIQKKLFGWTVPKLSNIYFEAFVIAAALLGDSPLCWYMFIRQILLQQASVSCVKKPSLNTLQTVCVKSWIMRTVWTQCQGGLFFHEAARYAKSVPPTKILSTAENHPDSFFVRLESVRVVAVSLGAWRQEITEESLWYERNRKRCLSAPLGEASRRA